MGGGGGYSTGGGGGGGGGYSGKTFRLVIDIHFILNSTYFFMNYVNRLLSSKSFSNGRALHHSNKIGADNTKFFPVLLGVSRFEYSKFIILFIFKVKYCLSLTGTCVAPGSSIY